MFQVINIGGATLPFVEDFENGLSGWEIVNPDGGITWASTTVNGTAPGSTGMFVNHYSYSTSGALDELVSPPLDFSNDTLVSMTFEYASSYYSSGYSDSLKVYVSSDCGTTWNLAAAYDATDASFSTAGALTSAFAPADSTYWCHGSSTVSCPSIDLDAYSGMSGVRVKFVAVNGYGNNTYLDNINITGQAQVAPVAAFAGDTATCTGKSVTFYDYSTPAPSARLWTFQGGTPSTSTQPNPTVTYSAAGTYDVKLVVQNAAGVDSITLNNYITITTSPTASVSMSVSGTTLCNGDSAFATATWTNGGAAPSLNWVLNGTVVASNTTSYANTFQNGDVLTVRLTSSDDCVANSIVADSVTFTVNSLPQVSLGSQGYVCELDGPQALSGGQPAGGIYSGAGVVNDSIYPSTAGVGSHWIYYTYTDASTGCSNTKQRAISVQPAPSQPTVTQNPTSGELEAGTPAGTFTYQWLDANMDPIAGATNATYLPAANGTYYVRIFSNILCSNVSDVYMVVNIGLDEELLSAIQIYPNPAQTKVQIALQGEAQVRIVDAAGREVYNNWVAQRTSIDVQDWARGAYIVQTIQGTESVHIPLIL
jgi:PKD repeat protein